MDWIKLNSNVSFGSNRNGTGLGFVFKPFNLDVDIAEAWALMQGLAWVVYKGFSKVEVECDSLGVVTALNSGDQVLSELGMFVNDIHLLSSNISVRVGHVPRECNELAHVIAKFAEALSSSRCWADSFPLWFSNVASSDFFV